MADNDDNVRAAYAATVQLIKQEEAGAWLRVGAFTTLALASLGYGFAAEKWWHPRAILIVGGCGMVVTVAAWSWIVNAWNYRAIFVRTAKRQELEMGLADDDLAPLIAGSGNETGSHEMLFNTIFLVLLIGFALFMSDAFQWR